MGNHTDQLRRCWFFAAPLTFVLALMVRFPIRIAIHEIILDVLFYGTISLSCAGAAIWLYRRFARPAAGLIAASILCACLAGWHVIDLALLRMGDPSVYGFGPVLAPEYGIDNGLAWYGHRFPKDLCHSLYETYFGTQFISITLEMDRDATWFACGG